MELKIYTSGEIETYIKHRKGEIKYGEYVQCAHEVSEDFSQHLKQSDAEYVLLGIPEDIGIQTALEKKGATSAWKATLDILLNTQHNTLNRANKLYILGHLVVEEELAILDTLNLSEKEDLEKAGELVACIDKEVTYIIYKIVACGKKPIVIGGGHNNAYGIIKGCALGFQKPVNVVNFDTRPDFKPKKRRHNGNGFSYAFSEGFLQRYYIFGLSENYVAKVLFKKLKKYSYCIQYTTFKTIAIQQKKSFAYYLNHALTYVSKNAFGIEVDCNAVADIPGNGIIPGGFNINHARQFVSFMKKHKHALYLHVCEAAPNPDDETAMQQTGTCITSLITDFMN